MANKRGQSPKPLKELLLENEKLYGKNALRAELEPRTEKIPTKPEDFSEMESDIWDYYVSTLDEYRLFTLANGPLLRVLTRLHYEAEIMNREIDTHLLVGGSIVELKDHFAMRDRIHSNMLKLFKQMGIGPMEIAKLGCMLAGGTNKKEEKDEFFD